MSMSSRVESQVSPERDRPEDALDDFVMAFERAYCDRGAADLASFLPPSGHPLRSAVLRELVRVDLEFRWEQDCPKDLSEYLKEFPGLADNLDGLREIAFEEYRLRRHAGQNPTPDEYLARYGIHLEQDVSRFRSLAPTYLGKEPPRGGGSDGPFAPGSIPGGVLSANADGTVGGRFAQNRVRHYLTSELTVFPEVGETFLGFHLVGELGRGSFGRVFLARQGELADRPVVLKVTADGRDESQTLARLRHDNIVPIHSCHRQGPLRAVCMPYLGSATLRDLFDDLKSNGALPDSGQGLLRSLSKSTVRKAARAGGSSLNLSASAPSASQPSSELGPGHTGTDACADTCRGEADATPARKATVPDATTDAHSALSGLSYVEAVVWLAARLTDGLAHAHDRDIVHRDMKPANILLTDDGEPLLLDFNLADDLELRRVGADPHSRAVGGTLPYMAPEHLDAFRGGRRGVDARSDIYAFGVIFYEMLTGRPPFPLREGTHSEAIREMIADRQGPAPLLRPWNPAISPAVESVIRHCLAPDPGDRYRTAHELGEDLRRHLAHQPLRHAPDPFGRERVTKWLRRHRRLVIVAIALLIGSGILLGFAAALATRDRQVDRFQAIAAATSFRSKSIEAQNALTLFGTEDPAKRREGVAQARQALAGIGAGGEGKTDWWEGPPASRLAPEDRQSLRRQAADLMLRLGWTALMQADLATESERPGYLRDASAAVDRAERCYGDERQPRSVWTLRYMIAERLDDRVSLRRAANRAQATPLVSAHDYALEAMSLADQGLDSDAAKVFDEATQRDPHDSETWLHSGLVRYRLHQFENAEVCLTASIAARPGHPSAWFDRGLVLMQRKQFAKAADDFEHAIRLRPGDPEPVMHKGFALQVLGRPADAVASFTRAFELGARSTRLYFLRAESRKEVGDSAGAERDMAEGLRREPGDEQSRIIRSKYREQMHDHEGALRDLDIALSLNPRSFYALQQKAGLIETAFGDIEGAIRVLDRLVELYPGDVESLASRSVYHARLGRREVALADAKRAQGLSSSPGVTYRIACTYALTSRLVPGDREEALRLFDVSLRDGFGLDIVGDDADLDPVRDDPRFARSVEDARRSIAARTAPPQTVARDATAGPSSGPLPSTSPGPVPRGHVP